MVCFMGWDGGCADFQSASQLATLCKTNPLSFLRMFPLWYLSFNQHQGADRKDSSFFCKDSLALGVKSGPVQFRGACSCRSCMNIQSTNAMPKAISWGPTNTSGLSPIADTRLILYFSNRNHIAVRDPRFKAVGRGVYNPAYMASSRFFSRCERNFLLGLPRERRPLLQIVDLR